MSFADDVAVVFGAILFVGLAVVATALGGSVAKVAVFAFGAVVFGAVITALTAAVFSFKLGALSRHFFFWLRFPCPGPGMLGIRAEQRTEGLSEKLENWGKDWFWFWF